MSTFELLKLIASFLTPLTILLLGIFINRKLEKNKIELTKEKDWQISWAKLLFDNSNELNENISLLITLLSEFSKNFDNEDTEKQINSDFNKITKKIRILEWNIQNYAQFAVVNGDTVVRKQKLLLKQLQTIIENRQGDLEIVRKTQFEYNDALRKAHAEILNIRNDKQNKYTS